MSNTLNTNIDKFFEIFTGGNHNVATWTPIAIKEFATDYAAWLRKLPSTGGQKPSGVSVDRELAGKIWDAAVLFCNDCAVKVIAEMANMKTEGKENPDKETFLNSLNLK